MRDTEALPDEDLSTEIVKSMTQFNAANRMRKEALRMVATTLSAADVRRLRTAFNAMDKNTDNVICIRELGEAISNLGIGVDIGTLMLQLDLDGDGLIDLNEFLLATAEVCVGAPSSSPSRVPITARGSPWLDGCADTCRRAHRSCKSLRTSTMCGGHSVRWTRTGCVCGGAGAAPQCAAHVRGGRRRA